MKKITYTVALQGLHKASNVQAATGTFICLNYQLIKVTNFHVGQPV